MFIRSFVFLLFLLPLLGQTRPPQGPDPWVVRAYYPDADRIGEVTSRIPPWEVNHEEGYLILEVDAGQYRELQELGYHLEWDEGKTKLLRQPPVMAPGQTRGIPGFLCYRTVEETFDAAQAIVNEHPALAQIIDAGDSWEKNQDPSSGYDMLVLKLTNSAIGGVKPKLIATTAIHAREYTTAELATRFAEYLVDRYNLDADVSWLLDYHEIHLMLHANPDGRKQAETGLFWRKNTNNNYCTGSQNRGADLNRNFEFLWSCCGGSSGGPCDETYRGPAPASETETQAIQNYLRNEFPDQRVDDPNTPAPDDATGVYLDIHSYSELVLWPWGYTSVSAPNGPALQTLGRKLAFFNDYRPEQSSELYPTDGTTDDFAYGDLGVAAYTIELGTSFFQNCDTFENTILPDNLQALIYAAKTARTPYLTPAGPDVRDIQAVTAAVGPDEPVTVTTILDDSRFNQSNGSEPIQNIDAAEGYVDTPPWAPGATAIPMTPSDGAFDSPDEAAQIIIDTTGLPDGRHILFLRARDTDGNWGAPSAIFFYILDPETAPRFEGFVRDEATGDPIEAEITAAVFATTSDPGTGFYSLMLPEGTYTLTASAQDHASHSVTGLAALNHTVVNQDFSLMPVCPVFEDDAESGNQGWTPDAPWAVTNEDAHGPTHSWTDSPGTNYANNLDISLTSPLLDLTDYQDTSLHFWHHYEIESGYDHGLIEYSVNGGNQWQQAADFTGTLSPWTEVSLLLPELDGVATAKIRLRLTTDSSQRRDGWFIDDFSLSGGSLRCAAPPPLEALLPSWPNLVDVRDLVQSINAN